MRKGISTRDIFGLHSIFGHMSFFEYPKSPQASTKFDSLATPKKSQQLLARVYAQRGVFLVFRHFFWITAGVTCQTNGA
jgi:hypothetical protein